MKDSTLANKHSTLSSNLSAKLEHLQERFEEISALLSDPDVIGNQNKFRKLSIEYSELEPVVQAYQEYRQVIDNMDEALAMMSEDDPDMAEMAEEEIREGKEQLPGLEHNLQMLLLPKDPRDGSNTFLEIRAGTGGDEAAIFAGDLFRMYSRYAERQAGRLKSSAPVTVNTVVTVKSLPVSLAMRFMVA